MQRNLIILIAFIFLCATKLVFPTVSLWQELKNYEAPEQKKFVFIICSCNNKKWYEENLEWAFAQDYPRDKFRFIYVDESRDGTADLVSACVTAHNEWDRFTLIRNDTWQSVMHNHYKAAHLCDDEEIIVHLDGDDFLKHDKVLCLLNKVYNKWDVWITYGQYEDWPNPIIGFSKEVPAHIAAENKFREMGFYYSHLRTAYAWLFKKIKLKDLIWKGSFIPTTPAVDYMFMFPMMEMAGDGHYKFIPDVLYRYNLSNSLSTCNMRIKLEIPPAATWEKYQPLPVKDNHVTQRGRNRHADLVVLSLDNPDELIVFASESLPNVRDIDTMLVLYRASSQENAHKYHSFHVPGKDCLMVNVDARPNYDSFNPMNYLTNEHCFIVANLAIKAQSCMASKWIFELERTFSKAFFLGLSQKSFNSCDEKINYGPFPECTIGYRVALLGNGIAAWQPDYETYVWDDPLLTAAVLVRKKDLESRLPGLMNDFTLLGFRNLLQDLMKGDREIALFVM